MAFWLTHSHITGIQWDWDSNVRLCCYTVFQFSATAHCHANYCGKLKLCWKGLMMNLHIAKCFYLAFTGYPTLSTLRPSAVWFIDSLIPVYVSGVSITALFSSTELPGIDSKSLEVPWGLGEITVVCKPPARPLSCLGYSITTGSLPSWHRS